MRHGQHSSHVERKNAEGKNDASSAPWNFFEKLKVSMNFSYN
jgi:hypothetical protein